MVQTAMSAVSEVDIVLYLAEAGWPGENRPVEEVDPVGPFHREMLADLAKSPKPVMLILTKIDVIPKTLLLPVMQAWSKAFDFKEIYPLSALTGDNVAGLVDVLRPWIPESEPLFPADTITDQSERAICAELIREQVFLQTRDEIPYHTAVTIDAFDESERSDNPTPKAPGLVRMAATIIVARDSHKGIVIGEGGARLKEIGSKARRSIEQLLGCRVWLETHVRVIPDWTEKKSMLAELGLSVK
jgi:GTP-binding protein Era